MAVMLDYGVKFFRNSRPLARSLWWISNSNFPKTETCCSKLTFIKFWASPVKYIITNSENVNFIWKVFPFNFFFFSLILKIRWSIGRSNTVECMTELVVTWKPNQLRSSHTLSSPISKGNEETWRKWKNFSIFIDEKTQPNEQKYDVQCTGYSMALWHICHFNRALKIDNNAESLSQLLFTQRTEQINVDGCHAVCLMWHTLKQNPIFLIHCCQALKMYNCVVPQSDFLPDSILART